MSNHISTYEVSPSAVRLRFTASAQHGRSPCLGHPTASVPPEHTHDEVDVGSLGYHVHESVSRPLPAPNEGSRADMNQQGSSPHSSVMGKSLKRSAARASFSLPSTWQSRSLTTGLGCVSCWLFVEHEPIRTADTPLRRGQSQSADPGPRAQSGRPHPLQMGHVCAIFVPVGSDK